MRFYVIFILTCSFLLHHVEARAWEPPATSAPATEDISRVRQLATKVSHNNPSGIWSFPDEDAEVAIIPFSDSYPDIYKIVMIFDVDMTPEPGTVIGYLSPTASSQKWHAWIYSKEKDGKLSSPKEFAATFSSSTQGETASLIFQKPEGIVNWRINPLGMIPFIKRILSVTITKKDVELPYGLYRKDTLHRLRWL